MLEKSENKSKTSWFIVNELTSRKSSEKKINIEGSPSEVANKFNHFFINSALSLLQKNKQTPFTYNVPYYHENFKFSNVSIQELNNCVKQLKNKHSAGYDEISTCLR